MAVQAGDDNDKGLGQQKNIVATEGSVGSGGAADVNDGNAHLEMANVQVHTEDIKTVYTFGAVLGR